MKDKILNFLISAILYFTVLTIIVALVSKFMYGDFVHGIVIVRIIMSAFFALIYPLEPFKK